MNNNAAQCYTIVIKRHEYPKEAPKTRSFVDPTHLDNAKTTYRNFNVKVREMASSLSGEVKEANIEQAIKVVPELDAMAMSLHNLGQFIENPPIVTEYLPEDGAPKSIKWDAWIESYDGTPILKGIKPYETKQDAQNAMESLVQFIRGDRFRIRVEG